VGFAKDSVRGELFGQPGALVVPIHQCHGGGGLMRWRQVAVRSLVAAMPSFGGIRRI